MYKIIVILIVTICFFSYSFAQSIVADTYIQFIPNEEADNPDEAGTAMPNIGISEEKPIIEVVEGVGHIPYNNIPFRASPSLTSRVLRYSSGAEKVILIGETDDWYKVIMYNNDEAYIPKKYVRTAKFFMDETIAQNHMNKTVSIKLEDLLYKFDTVLENSSYTKKHQIRPMFELIDAKNVKNNVTLIFHYSCADLSGKPIPSYNDNFLYTQMQQLVELILGRLILTSADSFNIIIKIPTYDEKGNVINFNKEYANIILMLDNVNIEKVRKDNISILSLAKSNIPVKDLFKTFPK